MHGECGTFTLTDAEKQALWESAMAAKEARAKALPDEVAAVRAIWEGYQRLQELGWREARYAPNDHSPLRLIEAGSTGIFTGYRDDIGFWVEDGDTWPSRPILWRPAPGETP